MTRAGVLAWAVPVALMAALLVGHAGGALAASKKASKKDERHFALTEATIPRVNKAWKLAEAEDYKGALEVLKDVAGRRSLKGHDKATVFNMMGMMEGQLGNFPAAITAFETSLAEDALPEAATLTIQYNLAQLYIAEEKFEKATLLLEQWFAKTADPPVYGNYLMAVSLAMQERYKEALPFIRRTVEQSEPRENFLTLQLAVEYQNGNVPETLAVLKALAAHFPKKNYFTQLSYAYSNAGDDVAALAVFELAYQQGWLDKEKDLLTLAQRQYALDVPYKAVQVIQKGIADGQIEPTRDSYELLANTLLSAREWKAALDPLRKAAELSTDGNIFVRLAQVHLELEDWASARKALEAALEKGDLKDTANAHMLLGIAQFNQKHFDTAKRSFQLAMRSEKLADTAQSWMEHVDRELSARAAAASN